MGIDPRVDPRIRPLSTLVEARASNVPGARLEALRSAAPRLADELKSAGPCLSVTTQVTASFPYPAKFGLSGAALSPAPYVIIRNAMQLVQVDVEGEVVNILVNPSDAERSAKAPFFAKQIGRYGELVSRKILTSIKGTTESFLERVGVDPADIDFVTFDHLHVQDVRGLLGTAAPEPGQDAPTPALLANAKLLVQRSELETFSAIHPLQRDWYVGDGVRDVPADRFIILDGDVAIGAGFAIVATPGHTAGNHTPVIVTDSGVWTISENGICAEAYAPQHSRIPGVRRHARDTGVEVILNGNTREGSLDQYTSMVLEKTLADPSARRPEFPQHFPSSEMIKSALAPGLSPTFTHDTISHGQVARGRSARAVSA